MTFISGGQCELTTLQTRGGTSSIYLPSLVESIAFENSHSNNQRNTDYTFHHHGMRNHRFKQPFLCRRLKRLITKKPSTSLHHRCASTRINSSESQTSPSPGAISIEGDQSIQEACESTSTRICNCQPYIVRIRDFCTTLSKSLGRLTGRRIPNENLLVLSLIQLLCGLAAIVLSAVAITKVVFLYRLATGLWSGALMLITGLHGIITVRRCTSRTLVSLLIFCILVALSACLLACVSVAGLIEDGILRPDKSLTILTAPKSPYYLSSQSDTTPHFRLDMPFSGFTHRRFVADIQPPRLHQVMLHVLLLVIGILEVSVSVGCAVLCCRQICPSDSSPTLSAMSYLQNRGATLVPGGTEFLLAIAAKPGRPAPLLLDHSLPQPDLHPSISEFLPRHGRRVVILTQAETGIHALAALQAVASVISPAPHLQVEEINFPSSSSSHVYAVGTSLSASQNRSRNRKESHKLKAQLSDLLPRLSSNDNTRSPHRTNLLYVLSSASANDPPMIFPPFPPAYYPPHVEDPALLRPFSHPLPQTRNDHEIELPFPSLSSSGVNHCHRGRFRYRSRSLVPPLFSNILRVRRGRSFSHRTHHVPASAVGLLGDRILQPVLVIEDNDEEDNLGPRVVNGTQTPPPSYSALETHRTGVNLVRQLLSTPEESFLPIRG